MALRCRVFRTLYGDQWLFVRRGLFLALGGFPDWPNLEDVEIVKRLGKLGKFVVTEENARTSASRWRTRGVFRTFLSHQAILAGYKLGLEPRTTRQWRGPTKA